MATGACPPWAKVVEQSQECGLNYTIKLKSGTLREVTSIKIHDLWPDFWVSDQSQTQSSFPEERLYSY
jgi:hypothetical protein